MNSSSADSNAIRVASTGHALFAAMMIWLGAMGFSKGTFVQVWQPVPGWVPAREALAYLCAFISLASGLGLLWKRTAAVAARAIFASLMVWLLALRLPNLFFQTPVVLVAWAFGSTAVMVAAAWVLYLWFAASRDRQRLGFIADDRGLRIARVLYGLSLIPFGLAHFMYLDATTVLIPRWLPWPAGWAYFTGAAFIAAGLAVAVGVCARLGATLSTLQMGLFAVIVWVPRVLAGVVTDFQWGEFVTTCALTAGAWVVADSYSSARLSRTERKEALMQSRPLRGLMLLGIILALSGAYPAAQDPDSIVGTWVLNVAKSRFSAGPPPRSETCTYVMERQDTKLTAKGVSEPTTYRTVRQDIKATATGVDADGRPTTREWTIVYDGKDRPVTGDPDADTLALKRIDTFTVAFAKKRAGAVALTGTWAISSDGNVMTITTQGVNAKGQTINDVTVFEKQKGS